jgi:predicted MFS family arabinose efflux permease
MSDRSDLSLRVLSLAYFTMGTGTFAIIGALPAIASSLSLGRGAIAMLVSVLAITFAVSAPVFQMVVGHCPRRTLILSGLTMMAAGAFGSALAPIGGAYSCRLGGGGDRPGGIGTRCKFSSAVAARPCARRGI